MTHNSQRNKNDHSEDNEKLTFTGKSFKIVDHFINTNEQYIFCKYWRPKTKPTALVLIVHGLGEHCARYAPVAEMLNQLGFLVFSHDHVGHGESEGYREDVTDYKIYLQDLMQHVNLMKEKHPDLPLCLFGHSMGGALAVLLAHENPDVFKCCVFSSPMITKNPQFTSVKLFLLRNLQSWLPHLAVTKLDSAMISRSPQEVQKYDDDPLVFHGSICLRMAFQLYRIADDCDKVMSDITYPFLVVHGDDDGLCDVAGSKNLHHRAKSADKTLKVLVKQSDPPVLYEGVLVTICSEQVH